MAAIATMDMSMVHYGGPLAMGPYRTEVDSSFSLLEPAPRKEQQQCEFYVRTGTCAYGDRCKFHHPINRPLPVLNAKGYPQRPNEPSCAHYIKKGWCAFGHSCRFHHPDLPRPTVQYDPKQRSYVPVANMAQGYPATAPTVAPTYYQQAAAPLVQPALLQAQPAYVYPQGHLVQAAHVAYDTTQAGTTYSIPVMQQQQQQPAYYSIATTNGRRPSFGPSTTSSSPTSDADLLMRHLAHDMSQMGLQQQQQQQHSPGVPVSLGLSVTYQ